jgi:hypothetical protein
MCRAKLLGLRLAEQVESSESFDRAATSESAQERASAEALYADLESLDPGDTVAVQDFLHQHFQAEIEDLDEEQMEACVKAFAAELASEVNLIPPPHA